jgi:tetratricopeptide (TPR) repeat protein
MTMPVRSLVILLLVAVTGALSLNSCSSTPSVPGHRRVDWYELDRQLDPNVIPVRSGWLGHALTRDEDWAGPAATFLPTVAFAASWDSLGAEQFAGLPERERERRQDAAAELVEQACIAVADRAHWFNRGVEGDFRDAMVMTRTLRRLHTAVGTDPGNTDAWFHLAIFSNVIGDRPGASLARRQYLAQTAGTPSPALAVTLTDRRCRLILDEAWDLRDSGSFTACLNWLGEHAQELHRGQEGPTSLAPATEANLVRALCHAELGDRVTARAYQALLPRISLQTSYVEQRNAQRYQRLSPDELRLWVQLWMDLRAGFFDAVDWRLVRRLDGIRSIAIIWRFWQDLGQIAAELGDDARAREYWVLAYWDRPYKRLFPQTAHRAVGSQRPEPGADLPYIQAYRTYFLGGSLWSYAVNRALAAQQSDPTMRPLLWQQALSSLATCIGRQFEPRAAHQLRARLHLLQGDWQLAATDLTSAARTDLPGSLDEAEHAYLSGVVALGTGQLAASRAWFEASLDREPDHAQAWQALAVVRAHAGEYDQALAAFDKVAELLPASGPVHYNRALLHLQQGDREAARADLEHAARLLPGQTEAVKLLGARARGETVTVDLTPQPVQLLTAASEGPVGDDLDEGLAGAAAAVESQRGGPDPRPQGQP